MRQCRCQHSRPEASSLLNSCKKQSSCRNSVGICEEHCLMEKRPPARVNVPPQQQDDFLQLEVEGFLLPAAAGDSRPSCRCRGHGHRPSEPAFCCPRPRFYLAEPCANHRSRAISFSELSNSLGLHNLHPNRQQVVCNNAGNWWCGWAFQQRWSTQFWD